MNPSSDLMIDFACWGFLCAVLGFFLAVFAMWNQIDTFQIQCDDAMKKLYESEQNLRDELSIKNSRIDIAESKLNRVGMVINESEDVA